ncbi:MAG: ATP-binding protein [Ruminococcus sp.]|jgi:AAA+ ATPase superfamily predicted ATPase|nr:ATP-binding protein [Ruminococcus sp.]
MFIGRETELQKLNEMYESDNFECAVVYGRRRVGKTTLIKEFIKNKRAVYFLARQADSSVNLTGFSNDVYAVTAADIAKNSYFTDWEKAFDYINTVSLKERLVLVIDEFPYLAEEFRPISSIIQAHIDNNLKDSKLFLILCGSSMSFMEKQVLGYKSPIYGRRTAQFKVLPFTFFEALPFFEAFKNEDKAVLYAITGGIPEYLNKINPKKSVRDNLISLFLTPSGHFFEEPDNLLKQELRDPSTYNGIIEAIADGASRLNEIATKCHIESNKCGKYLTSLISLGIVKKEIPVTDTTSKKSIYLLDDMMFRFWYRFVFPNLSAVVSGLGEQLYDTEIAESISAYMGLVFEDICKQFIILEAKQNHLPFLIGKIGRWWGNNPEEKRQEEIDILTFRSDNALFCECKWTNSFVDIDVLRDLMKQSELFSYAQNYFWIFAKKGVTKRLKSEAERLDNVRLIAFDEMV